MDSTILEWMVFIVQTLVISVGYPAQINKNYHNNENGEHSFKLYLITLMFILRSIQNVGIDAWYYYIPDGLGIVLMIVTISQIKWPTNVVARIVSHYFDVFPEFIKLSKKKWEFGIYQLSFFVLIIII